MRKHRRKRAYISGPIRASTFHQRELNIRQAEETAIELVKMGYNVHCPHSLARFVGDAIEEEEWIQLDLEMLPVFDCIVMCPGWPKSQGSIAERAVAKKYDMPIFCWPKDRWKLVEWQEGKPWSLLKTASLS